MSYLPSPDDSSLLIRRSPRCQNPPLRYVPRHPTITLSPANSRTPHYPPAANSTRATQARYVPSPIPPTKNPPQFDELFFPLLLATQYLPSTPTSSPSSLCRNASRSSREGFINTPSKHQSRCLTRRARRTLARRLYVVPHRHSQHYHLSLHAPRDHHRDDLATKTKGQY